ncbi:MAG TPA: universal stress protein [Casimicrobiaceae bacterium]|jgi:nucleotide-binding universal stress UspA family protein|nr:universal stress protein [Casimicrobiaceae bacterium]
MFKCILVALDGSTASNAGFKSALQLASDQQASLVALHVIDDGAITVNFEGGYVPAAYVDRMYESLRESGRAILAKAETVAKAAGAEMKTVLVETRGHTIAHAILAQARKAKADLIVIGTHGRRGLSRLLMGSDAEAVVREARVPVMLVRMPERAAHKRAPVKKQPTASGSKRVVFPATVL